MGRFADIYKSIGDIYNSASDSFYVGNASAPLSDTVKNLGVTLDCHLSLKTHVLNLVRRPTANFELRRIGSIRSLLITEATGICICFHPFTS